MMGTKFESAIKASTLRVIPFILSSEYSESLKIRIQNQQT